MRKSHLTASERSGALHRNSLRGQRAPERPSRRQTRRLKSLSGELARLTRWFEAASALARIGGWELKLPDRQLVWSRELYRIHDLEPGLPVALGAALDCYPDEPRKPLQAAIEEAIRSGRSFVVEAPLVTATGSIRWVCVSGEAELVGGSPVRLIGTMQDITDQRQREREFERLAKHDDLTGLPNRKLFNEELELAMRAADARRGKLALMLIDLDNFKTVNDTFGHDAGDRLLAEFARRLKLCYRPDDTIARLGGDEFAVMLPHWPGPERLESIIRRIRLEMAGGCEICGDTVEISASSGTALYPDHAADAMELLKQADIALYVSKSAGRAIHRLYHRSMGERLALRHQTFAAIRNAIASREIVPFYQPIVHAIGLKPVGLEALVRWVRGDGRIIPPALFMSTLADPALASTIGEIMLTAVAGQIAQWQEEGLPSVTVSVNVAPDQMARPDFALALLNLLDAYGVKPGSLAVEITEDVILSQDQNRLIGTFETLTRAGVKIDLDDFGTGYASLTHLKEYPIDRIKLDRSFVSQLPRDGGSLGIVRAVISLAHELSKQVIAEGVETSEQAQLLAEMGCDLLQGYLFSKPVAAAEAGDYLRQWAGLPTLSGLECLGPVPFECPAAVVEDGAARRA